jgi:DNA-binding NarL/FixJ family response regulator
MPGVEETSAVRRPVSVLAVDDHRPFLGVLKDVVSASLRFELVAEAESGEEAIELAGQVRPDMVLMDVHLPGLGGIEAAKRIKASLPKTIVVLVSTTHPDELPSEAGTLDAVVWKSELRPRLLDAIWLRNQVKAGLPPR